MVKRVYRIEHPSDGLGPWQSEHRPSKREFGKSAITQPTPVNDSYELSDFLYDVHMTPRGRNYVFGFESLDSLASWFRNPTWLRRLADKGFRVSVYDSVSVVAGRAQVVFDRSTAIKVDSISLRSKRITKLVEDYHDQDETETLAAVQAKAQRLAALREGVRG